MYSLGSHSLTMLHSFTHLINKHILALLGYRKDKYSNSTLCPPLEIVI